LETRDKAKEWGLTNIEVHSYHSFSVKYYSKTAFTDAGITKFLKQKKPPLCKWGRYDIIVIDEAQDMSNTYFSLVCRIWHDNNNPGCKLIICGDVNQCIFRFNGADSRYISLADRVYAEFKPGVAWKTLRLATSFRCPIEITQFINKCVLKSDRMVGARQIGHKPRYVICDTFGKKPYQEVVKYFKAGYKYEELFIIAPSIKAGTGKSPVRRLANALSLAGIPIFVPADDEDKLDEDVCKGKVVFASFHQVKGLERKAIILFNFDASYFKYYSKGTDPKVCPNELYVALTRAKERMTMFHQVGNDALHFFELNHKYAECESSGFGFSNDDKRAGPAIEKAQELAVTQLLNHMRESVITRAMEYFTVNQIRKKSGVIKLKTKTEQGSLTESVAELNGLVVPAIYEYRATGNMQMYQLVKTWTQMDLQPKSSLPALMQSIPEILELANVWNSTKTGFIFKIKQITKYDWLSESELEACLGRLKSLGLVADGKYEYYLSHQGARELYNRKLVGYADYVDNNRVFEFKCVQSLDPVHFIQLAIYMYLVKIENQRSMIKTHGAESLAHVKPGDMVLVNLYAEPTFGSVETSVYSELIAGKVVMCDGGQYIIAEGEDKVHDLRERHMVMNLSWVAQHGLLKKYSYYLYNILTDELFEINGDLSKLRQMVDYLIYEKYYCEQKKTDEEFLHETREIKGCYL
jgi:hypothetical protein